MARPFDCAQSGWPLLHNLTATRFGGRRLLRVTGTAGKSSSSSSGKRRLLRGHPRSSYAAQEESGGGIARFDVIR